MTLQSELANLYSHASTELSAFVVEAAKDDPDPTVLAPHAVEVHDAITEMKRRIQERATPTVFDERDPHQVALALTAELQSMAAAAQGGARAKELMHEIKQASAIAQRLVQSSSQAAAKRMNDIARGI